jgi:hypothetical protein
MIQTVAGRRSPRAPETPVSDSATIGAENVSVSFLPPSDRPQGVFDRDEAGLLPDDARRRLVSLLVRSLLRFDIACHRRPRLFEALLSIVGIPALCLFMAGAGLYVVGEGRLPEVADLLAATMPLALTAYILGARRRRLGRVFGLRQISALRAIVSPEQWRTVGDEARDQSTAVWAGLRPATLRTVLSWLDAPRWYVNFQARRRLMHDQLEAFNS